MIKASIQNAIANNMAGRQQKIKKRLGSEGEYQMQRKKWVEMKFCGLKIVDFMLLPQ